MDEGELEQNVSLDDDELDLVKENMLDHKIDLLVFLASSDCILNFKVLNKSVQKFMYISNFILLI